MSGSVRRIEERVRDQWLRSQCASAVRLAVVFDRTRVVEIAVPAVDGAMPPGPGTLFRAGSISKLFNALVACRAFERGGIDLSEPLSEYLPRFLPREAASVPTCEQLLSHTGGVQREAPIGSYFDASEPTLAATTSSVFERPLVDPPGFRTKYSNVGASLVGRAVEIATGIPFSEIVRSGVFEPLEMTDSTFAASESRRHRVAPAVMNVAQSDGTFRARPAPFFRLGTVPAGELVTTAHDLGRLLVWILTGGSDASVVSSETFARMLTPVTDRFALGFSVGKHGAYRTVGHSGAVYGFSSHLVAVPEAGVGVAVLAAEDLVLGPVADVARIVLEELLGSGDEPRPRGDLPVGRFEGNGLWLEFSEPDTGPIALLSGRTVELDPAESGGYWAHGSSLPRCPVITDGARVKLGNTVFCKPGAASSRSGSLWPRDVVGAYGPEVCGLLVRDRDGTPYAMTENMYEYRIEHVEADSFAMPHGMYERETLTFRRDDGKVVGLDINGVALPRRA